MYAYIYVSLHEIWVWRTGKLKITNLPPPQRVFHIPHDRLPEAFGRRMSRQIFAFKVYRVQYEALRTCFGILGTLFCLVIRFRD